MAPQLTQYREISQSIEVTVDGYVTSLTKYQNVPRGQFLFTYNSNFAFLILTQDKYFLCNWYTKKTSVTRVTLLLPQNQKKRKDSTGRQSFFCFAFLFLRKSFQKFFFLRLRIFLSTENFKIGLLYLL